MTIKELRMRYPKEVAQIEAEAKTAAIRNNENVNAAVEEERNRIAAIDAVAELFDSELVREAKYGKEACTAEELAIRAKLPENHIGAARNQVKTILH